MPGGLLQRCDVSGSGSSSKDADSVEKRDDDDSEEGPKKKPATRKDTKKKKKDDDDHAPLGFKSSKKDDDDDEGSDQGAEAESKRSKKQKSMKKPAKAKKDKKDGKKNKSGKGKKRNVFEGDLQSDSSDSDEGSVQDALSQQDGVTKEQLDAAMLQASHAELQFVMETQAPSSCSLSIFTLSVSSVSSLDWMTAKNH